MLNSPESYDLKSRSGKAALENHILRALMALAADAARLTSQPAAGCVSGLELTMVFRLWVTVGTPPSFVVKMSQRRSAHLNACQDQQACPMIPRCCPPDTLAALPATLQTKQANHRPSAGFWKNGL